MMVSIYNNVTFVQKKCNIFALKTYIVMNENKKYMQKCRDLLCSLIGMKREEENVTLTLKVSNVRVCGKSIAELESLLNRNCKVVSILQNDGTIMRMAAADIRINAGDQLLVQVCQQDENAVQALVGERL